MVKKIFEECFGRREIMEMTMFITFLKTEQLYLIFLVFFLYFLPPWNLLRLPDASAKQVLKETHEHRRQDAPKRCIWSWWCVATVVHLNDAHPSQWCTGVRDSSTQGHKGNHNGQVDGFSLELLVFKHEKQKICFGFIYWPEHHLSKGILCSKI